MAVYLSVDLDLLQRGLSMLPPLPRLLLQLAWGSTMLKDPAVLRAFAETGSFPAKDTAKGNALPPLKLAS